MKMRTLAVALLALAPSALAQTTLDGTNPKGLHDLFGQVLTAANQTGVGNELFAATEAGGGLLADLNPGPAYGFYDGDPEVGFPTPLEGTILGGDLFSFAYLANNQIGLFRTDGTAGGTVVLRPFPMGGGPTYFYGYGFEGVALRDVVVFNARQTATTWGLWASDGTPAGTQLIGATPSLSWGFTRLGNQALFFTYIGSWQLGRTDGTSGGTTSIHSFPAGASIDVESLTVVGERVFFVAGDGATGQELWTSDGTLGGTSLVRDILPGPDSSEPEELVRVGDALYFSASDGSGGRLLYRSDGTTAGTTQAATIPSAHSDGPRHLTPLGERLFFAHRAAGKDRLYVHDDAAGSLVVAAEFDDGQDEEISHVRAIGSRRVFFQGYDFNQGGGELWVSDGSAHGATLFEDVLPGGFWSSPREMMLSNGRMFFTAYPVTPVSRALLHRDVGATAQALGTGCSASGRLPFLSADDPVLGDPMTLRIEGAEPSQAVLLYFGPPSVPTALGSAGCFVYLDPAAFALLASGQTDGAGKWTSAPIGVPNNPALIGAQLSLQAVVGPTATLPLGADLSSAVLLTFGD